MPGRGVPVPALRDERIRAALTQDELAEASGVARSTIARIETGDQASIPTVRRLARALRLEPADLMGMDRPAVVRRVAERRGPYQTRRHGPRATEPGASGDPAPADPKERAA
jgi:transcriptional regulator with XRE-family HTH domain